MQCVAWLGFEGTGGITRQGVGESYRAGYEEPCLATMSSPSPLNWMAAFYAGVKCKSLPAMGLQRLVAGGFTLSSVVFLAAAGSNRYVIGCLFAAAGSNRYLIGGWKQPLR